MVYLGKSKTSGDCPICKHPYKIGDLVYHNTAKRLGVHLAHKECWERLLASRPRKWGESEPVLSQVELDPPF